jgi:hypothetical protein
MRPGPWISWGVQEIQVDALLRGLGERSQIAHKYDLEWVPETAFLELKRSSSELSWIDAEYALVGHFTEDTVLVDLLGASRALDEAHVRQAGGADANQWTALFERQVQEAIDGTSWRPMGESRGLIGRTLRFQGRDLTDLDAVGECNGVLLLVDAKAWATPATLDNGEFWAVRDRAAVAEEAVVAWQEKMDVIRQHPEVLGLSDTPPTIIGLVVAPEAPYVPFGPSTREVIAGLMAVSSLAELEYCLTIGSEGQHAQPDSPHQSKTVDWRDMAEMARRRAVRAFVNLQR